MQEPRPPQCCEAGLAAPEELTDEEIAQIAKSLGNPARMRILRQFDVCRPLKVQDVVDNCELAQSTVSEHLRVLREAGVLFATEDGPRVWYCMRRSVVRAFAEAVRAVAAEHADAAA